MQLAEELDHYVNEYKANNGLMFTYPQPPKQEWPEAVLSLPKLLWLCAIIFSLGFAIGEVYSVWVSAAG